MSLTEMRFLYIRTALLGHFLLSTLQHRYHPQLSLMRGEKASLGQAVALRVCILCIETVHTLVAAMHSNLHVVFRSPGCHIHCESPDFHSRKFHSLLTSTQMPFHAV
jgi:hypothetical protein